MNGQAEIFCAHPPKLLLELVKVLFNAEVNASGGCVVGSPTPNTPIPHCPSEVSLASEELSEDHTEGRGVTLPLTIVDLDRSRWRTMIRDSEGHAGLLTRRYDGACWKNILRG